MAIRFTTSATKVETLSEILDELGALSVSIDDADAGTEAESPIFGEPGMPEEALWRTCSISALFLKEIDPHAIIAAASKAIGLAAPPPFTVETVEEADWVRLTQAQFDPIRISRRLWIVPSWHEPPDSQAINIQLDPGVAFGTGSHPTTKLCLRWLDEHIRGGETLIDYGCGSGILGITAKKLGAAYVLGIDIDSQAIEAARHNAQANGVVCEFRLPEKELAVAAHVTVANILSSPLKLLAPLLAGCTTTGGWVVLSGILTVQTDEIIACYEEWFAMQVYAEESGWVCLVGRKQCA